MIERYKIHHDADDNERAIKDKKGKWVKYEDFIAIINKLKNCYTCKNGIGVYGDITCGLSDAKYFKCQDSEPRFKYWELR